MNQLQKIGFTEQELLQLIQINPNIKELDCIKIKNLIQLLEYIGCKEYHIKDIIFANPFCLERSIADIQGLINKLLALGMTNLEITFDSNPWLLNKDAFEIDSYIEERMDVGCTLEEAIDEIDAGILFF